MRSNLLRRSACRSIYLLAIFTLTVSIAAPVSAILSDSIARSAPERSISIASLRGKDLVHPTLSPDGRFLAYAEAILVGKNETTAVRILNLVTQTTVTLLDSKQAEKYKVYSVYARGIEWSQLDRLVVTIGDGDVGSATLTFNPFTRKLIATKQTEGLEIDEKLLQRVRSKFPSIKEDDLIKSTFIHDRDLLIITGNLFGKSNLWRLDLAKGAKQALLPANSPMVNARIASYRSTADGSILMALTTDFTDTKESVLYRYERGKLQRLQVLPFSNLDIVYGDRSRIYMLDRRYPTYARGNNPLYILENGKLRQSQTYKLLYDVSIDRQGTRIAYCYWDKTKRSIEVKSLVNSD